MFASLWMKINSSIVKVIKNHSMLLFIYFIDSWYIRQVMLDNSTAAAHEATAAEASLCSSASRGLFLNHMDLHL